MKTLYSTFASILFTIILTHQSCNPRTEFAQRMVRGGPEKVIIDNRTSLKILIKKLNSPWEWAETGAGYWIGYTDDMFSIASYKDKAVKPLTSFIRETDSIKGKIGGLFTLHLIGIDSKVVGRQNEEFKDTLARDALLSFIDDKDLHEYVIFLLKRDPWAYDIPTLINYLSTPDRDYSYVLCTLRRYQPFHDFLPLWQPLPDSLLDKELDMYLNKDGSNEKIAEMIALKHAFHGRVWVDQNILQSNEWTEGLECFKNKTNHYLIPTIYADRSDTTYSKPLIKFMDTFFFHPFQDYSSFKDDKIIYAYKNDSLFIYSPEGARNLILKYWRLKSK